MSKHTPGPYRRSETDTTTIVDDQGRYLAYVMTFDDDGTDVLTREECEANADLFAAVTELAEALELLLWAINDPNPEDHFYEAEEKARAALRKAGLLDDGGKDA